MSDEAKRVLGDREVGSGQRVCAPRPPRPRWCSAAVLPCVSGGPFKLRGCACAASGMESRVSLRRARVRASPTGTTPSDLPLASCAQLSSLASPALGGV
jgi:hypothetical protein